MDYEQAYLHLFNRLTDIIELIEKLDPNTEQVDMASLLKQVQVEAEEQCIR